MLFCLCKKGEFPLFHFGIELVWVFLAFYSTDCNCINLKITLYVVLLRVWGVSCPHQRIGPSELLYNQKKMCIALINIASARNSQRRSRRTHALDPHSSRGWPVVPKPHTGASGHGALSPDPCSVTSLLVSFSFLCLSACRPSKLDSLTAVETKWWTQMALQGSKNSLTDVKIFNEYWTFGVLFAFARHL